MVIALKVIKKLIDKYINYTTFDFTLRRFKKIIKIYICFTYTALLYVHCGSTYFCNKCGTMSRLSFPSKKYSFFAISSACVVDSLSVFLSNKFFKFTMGD